MHMNWPRGCAPLTRFARYSIALSLPLYPSISPSLYLSLHLSLPSSPYISLSVPQLAHSSLPCWHLNLISAWHLSLTSHRPLRRRPIWPSMCSPFKCQLNAVKIIIWKTFNLQVKVLSSYNRTTWESHSTQFKFECELHENRLSRWAAWPTGLLPPD